MVKLSILVPAHNEAPRLRYNILKLVRYLQSKGYDFELIIAEDGSTDGTDEIASQLASQHPRIIHLHSSRRLGRGRALRAGFRRARGELVGYMDADLATELIHIPQAISALESGADLVTGSRMIPGARVSRSMWRWVLSIGYNCLVRLICGSKIRDHQCGFKFFSRRLMQNMLDKANSNHWFWDTEILVRSQRYGFACLEIPVCWRESGSTKLSLSRDSLEFIKGILKLAVFR